MAADKEDFLARMVAIHEKRVTMLDDHQKRMMATKITEQNPEMIQSIEEHQDVPIEDVAVIPVAKPRKRHRGRKSTAGRRGEPNKLNRGNHGSRRKLAASCRKVSRHAAVVWRKRNLIRQIGTEVNWGTRSTVTVAGMRMTRYAGMAWLRGGIMRKNCTRTEDERATRRLGPLKKNTWTTHKRKK
jgi:hypothetical protein